MVGALTQSANEPSVSEESFAANTTAPCRLHSSTVTSCWLLLVLCRLSPCAGPQHLRVFPARSRHQKRCPRSATPPGPGSIPGCLLSSPRHRTGKGNRVDHPVARVCSAILITCSCRQPSLRQCHPHLFLCFCKHGADCSSPRPECEE